MSAKLKYFISFLFALLIGCNLYYRSDPPPYGYPPNDLSNFYWPICVDIANAWRNFDFGFWNRELAGGISLFTSGQYPIFSPTNFLAWFLTNDQFYLVKLIEPYVIGIFLMMIVLWDVFKVRWYIACFGALAYMGLPLCKTTTLTVSPYPLIGIALFPGFIIILLKLYQRSIYLAAVGIGALLSLQFAMGGVYQIPQMTTWWILFFFVYCFSNYLLNAKDNHKELWKKNAWLNTKAFVILCTILVAITFGLLAVQMMPSFYYFKFQSFRTLGRYPINNLALISNESQYSLGHTFYEGLFNSSPLRTKLYSLILMISLALSVVNFRNIFAQAKNKKFVYVIWITTLTYAFLPSVAKLIADLSPVFEAALTPFKYFTFLYGIYSLEFCIILSVCLILNDEHLKLFSKQQARGKTVLSSILLVLLVCVTFLPSVLHVFEQSRGWTNHWYFLNSYVPSSSKKIIKVLIPSLCVLVFFSIRPLKRVRHIVLAFYLLSTGSMMVVDSFKTYDKGSRNHPQRYMLESPEYKYYSKAKGKISFTDSVESPEWTAGNFNLLHGVYGLDSYFGSAPLRLTHFSNDYKRIDSVPGAKAFYEEYGSSSDGAITTHFPADFTIILKNSKFNWKPEFTKVIEGEQFDVYERSESKKEVYFANDLRVLPYMNVIRSFTIARSDMLFVEQKDAQDFGLKQERLMGDPKKAMYSSFKRNGKKGVEFQVQTDGEMFVVLPDSYQKGWKVFVDGKKTAIFPAQYLFVGFKVPGGNHSIVMRYVPPLFGIGLMVSVITLLGLVYILRKK